MEMTFRWFGTGHDSVTLKQIRQIAGVKGVITTLYDSVPGEAWEMDAILKLKKEVEDAGLKISGIESVNVCDAIKVGAANRDECIDNYIKTLERLGEADIHMVCYNFMPVFDWTRTELARMRLPGPASASAMALPASEGPHSASKLLIKQSDKVRISK